MSYSLALFLRLLVAFFIIAVIFVKVLVDSHFVLLGWDTLVVACSS